jgi:hypothetical protein
MENVTPIMCLTLSKRHGLASLFFAWAGAPHRGQDGGSLTWSNLASSLLPLPAVLCILSSQMLPLPISPSTVFQHCYVVNTAHAHLCAAHTLEHAAASVGGKAYIIVDSPAANFWWAGVALQYF